MGMWNYFPPFVVMSMGKEVVKIHKRVRVRGRGSSSTYPYIHITD